MSLSKDPRRLRNVTATEMSVLFGLNPFESPAKLIDKKDNPKEINNNHVRRGKIREPSVLEAFLLDGGIETDRHYGPTQVKELDRIAATPDAYIKGTKNVVECKTTLSNYFDKWYDAIPLYYHLQVHTQMYVMDSEEGYIGALEEGDPRECEYRFVAWKVIPHPRIYELMVQEVSRFWELKESGKLFRVLSPVKKEMTDLLNYTSTLIIPTTLPIKEKTEDEDNELSQVLAMFNIE